MKVGLNKVSDGPSIDQMVDASKEFVNIEANRTAQAMRKTYQRFQGLREEVTLPLNIEIPKTQTEFNLGLMFRESLNYDSGMLFIFDEVGQKSFHMKDTKIPLDIALLKKMEQLRVLKN